LTIKQCYLVAKTAQRNKFYTLALEWYNVALSRLQNSNYELNDDAGSLISITEKGIASDIHSTISEVIKFFSITNEIIHSKMLYEN
jgi:hypothetical protein